MKTLISLTFFCLLIISCEKNEAKKICDVKDPTKELPWLKELIAKAETDTTGHYKGVIYLEEYDGKDVFFVDMSMGSGGLMGYWFNCDGTPVDLIGEDIFPKCNYVIYKNISL